MVHHALNTLDAGAPVNSMYIRLILRVKLQHIYSKSFETANTMVRIFSEGKVKAPSPILALKVEGTESNISNM